MQRIKTFYDELGIPRDATAAAIKRAFKDVAKVYHPDKKYEQTPLQYTRPRRRPHEQNAIEREYAQVSVEIMNLAGKYSNCRLKMMIGAIVGSVAAVLHLSTYFIPSDIFQDFPI